MNLQPVSEVSAASGHDAIDLSQMGALRRWSQVTICAGLGLVGGALGVALTIGLAILVQLRVTSESFAPGAMPLIVTAVLMGLGATWLLGRIMRRILPHLFYGWGSLTLETTLMFSIFTSLVQSVWFTHGL